MTPMSFSGNTSTNWGTSLPWKNYTPIKRNVLSTDSTAWVDLKEIMLNEEKILNGYILV